MPNISEGIVVPIDVKCTHAGCNCFREGVSGGITKQGGYLAPEGEKSCPKCNHPSTEHTVVGETKSDYEKEQEAKKKFKRAYGFDVRTDDQNKTIDYTCKTCGREENGGGIPNPGLYERMKQHLRESHAIQKDDKSLKREDVVSGGDLVQVWFGYDS